MRLSIAAAILLPLGFLLAPIATHADTVAAPFSYLTPSADGRFVFVMLAPVDPETDGEFLDDDGEALAQFVRKTYTTSGLYRSDDAAAPLWTVDWYAYRVHVASDGVHVVREGPWASNGSTEAFTVFANGLQVRSYAVGDIVDLISLLPHTSSHFEWLRTLTLDDDSTTLSIETLHHDQYTIDLRSGDLASSFRPTRLLFAFQTAVILSLLLFCLTRRLW